jgi:CRISPR-associated protein Cas2
MSRRHFLISYDVSDDRRRSRVFDILSDYGNHTQFSVFLCDLDEAELATIRGRFTEEIHARQDQVLIVDLGLAQHDLDTRIESVGIPFNPRTRAFIV